jgi:glycosyltransferase involved in cell wall biosynthesis
MRPYIQTQLRPSRPLDVADRDLLDQSFGQNLRDIPRRPLPRVLYAIGLDGSQKLGSLEEQIYLLAQAFRAEDSLLLPLFLDPAGPDCGGTQVFKAAGLPAGHLSLSTFRWRSVWKLNKLIHRQRIQLIHWNFYPPLNGYYLALSALRPRLRHYFTDHNSRALPLSNSPTGVTRLVKRALLKRYEKVLCVSQFVADCLAEQGCWSNVKCCRHFINTERFRPDSAERQEIRRERACEDRFVVLAVAHLIQDKGIDVAIKALAETPPKTVLWIVGSGHETTNLQALTAELGVQDRVTFFGQQAQVQPFMQAADCMVCPSLWAEAAGLVNLEGLSTGLPVVASRVGGIPEYVDDGTTGMLFPPGDYHALAALLRQLHDNPDHCRRLGLAARHTAIQRFSVASKLHEHLDHYRIGTDPTA